MSEEGRGQVVAAIGDDERLTSGEIRVHLEPKCKLNSPCERDAEVFAELKMHETRLRNGVLIYIAFDSKKFAIIGDQGINEKVPDNFWEEEKELLKSYLIHNQAADGLCKVIGLIGDRLSEFFPIEHDDVNEQSDEISIGE